MDKMQKILKTPLTENDVRKLTAGEIVYLSGRVYTARDKAHARILECLNSGKKPPFDLGGGVIFHAGPLVKKDKNWQMVAIGPTTSFRMNGPTPEIIEKLGIRAIIGKGGMCPKSQAAMRNKCVYLSMTGGCAATGAKSVEKIAGVWWPDLGTAEAVWGLDVKKLGPLVVSMDARGRNLYGKDKHAGASASFSDVHLVRALFALREKTGRKKLVKTLGVGEGSVRTILKKLREKELIKSEKSGQSLSPMGVKQVETILKKFGEPFEVSLDMLGGKQFAITIHNGRDVSVLSERDIAVKAGAEGAVIMVHKGGGFQPADKSFRISDFPKTEGKLRKIKAKEGDILALAFAKNYNDAENGAVAIALEISGLELFE